MTEITFKIDLESGDGDWGEAGMRLIHRGTCLSVCLFRKFGTYSSKADISRMFRFFPAIFGISSVGWCTCSQLSFGHNIAFFHLQWTLNPAHSLVHTLACFNTERALQKHMYIFTANSAAFFFEPGEERRRLYGHGTRRIACTPIPISKAFMFSSVDGFDNSKVLISVKYCEQLRLD